jgi:hypothetical protein
MPFPPMPDFPPGFPFPEPPISQPIEPPVRSLYAAPAAPAGGISITGSAQQLDVVANQIEQRIFIS